MNKKKLLALLMALVMTLTLVPVTALADDEPVAKIGDTGYATLKAAFDAVQDCQTITLLNDVNDNTLGGKGIVVDKSNASITLDLNGYDITCMDGSAASNRMIKVVKGTLNVVNSSPDQSVLDVDGSTESTTKENANSGVSYPYGVFRVEKDGVLNVTGTDSAGDKNIKLVNGRGNGLNIKVIDGRAIIENVLITSTWGGGIEVTSDDDPAYPTKENATGYARLTNCVVNQTKKYDWCSVPVSVSGNATVDVYSTTYSGEYALYIFSSGGTINAYGGDYTGTTAAIMSYLDMANYPNAEGAINISGGTYTGVINFANQEKAALTITGGTFDHDPTAYVPTSGYKVTKTGDNTWTVQPEAAPVAQIVGGNSYETLQAAIDEAQAGDTVKLLADVEDADGQFGTYKSLTLDLDGHTLTCAWLFAYSNATLTVENGTIIGNVESYGIYGAPTVNIASDATVNGYLLGWGNGNEADSDEYFTPTLNVHGTVYNDDYFAITTNGMDDHNPIINVYEGASVTSDTASAIYMPSGTLNISGGTITGATAVYQKSGNLNITGGTFRGTLNPAHEYSYYGNGCNATGDAIVIDNCGYPNGAPTAYIKNAAITSAHGKQIGYYVYGSSTEGEVVADTEYTLNTNAVRGWLDNAGDIDGNYPKAIGELPNVAKINDKEYLSLEEAFAEVQDGQTITLLYSVELKEPLNVNLGQGKSVTLDLGGLTLTGRTNLKSGNLTIKNGTVDGGDQQAMNVYGSANPAVDYSVLTLEEGLNVNADLFAVCLFGPTYSAKVGYGAVINTAADITTTGNGAEGAIFVSGNLGQNITGDMNNKINITGGEVRSYNDCAIALNGLATVTISNDAEISGNTAIAVKRGTLNVTGGDIFADGVKNYPGTPNNNGTEMTGAAISISDTYNQYGPLAVTISKNAVISSNNADAVYKRPGTYSNAADISITGGKFSSEPDSSYVADGYKAVELDATYEDYEGYFQVGKATITPTLNSDEPDKVTYRVDTVVNSTDGENDELESKTDLEITVVGNDTEKTNKDGSGVDKAALSNIKNNDTLKAIVTDAIEAAGASIGADTQSAEIVIQLAKSAPEKETGKVTYEVHPEAVITVGGTEVGTVALSNNQLNGNFSFTLDVSSLGVANGDSVKVTHKHENGDDVLGENFVVKNGKITISNINSFSEFIVEKVNDDPESDTVTLTFKGTSLRRRVRVVNEERTNYVVRSSTDARFEFTWDLPTGYSVVQDESKFEWSKDGVNWTSATVASINGNGANLVIEGIPSWAFNTSIHTRLTLAYSADGGNTFNTITLTADTRTVNEVANSLSKSTTAALKWVDYAKYLLGSYSSYTIDPNKDNGYTVEN